MNYMFWNYKEEYEIDGSYESFTNAPDEELNWLSITDIIKVIKQIKNLELKSKMTKRLETFIINKSYVDIELYPLEEIFTKEQLDRINNNIIEELKKRINDYNYLNTINEYLFSKRTEETIIKKSNIVFDLINNSNREDKKELNTKILFNILSMNKKAFEEIYGYFKYPYQKELDEYLKMETDSKYISRRISKYEDKQIGIDPNIPIGLEIEINSKYNLNIDLYGQDEYHKYRVGTDATVPNGYEIDSGIIHDGKDIPALYAFCESMQNIGLYKDTISNNIGGQINLGLDYLDTKESFRNFIEIFTNVEELLFYISNEEGEIIRQPLYSSSRFKPISEMVGTRIIDENLTREDLIKMFYTKDHKDDMGLLYKKNTMCVRDFGVRGKERIEFRIPNGTINPNVWVDNIRLYGKIFEISKYLDKLREKDYLSEREEEQLNLFVELQEEHSLEEKLEILMNLLFEDKKIKQIYIDRYNATLKAIKETHTENYHNPNNYYYQEPGFGNVELIDRYYSNSDKFQVVEYDPITEEYKESGPKL